MAQTESVTATDASVIRTMVHALTEGDWVRFNGRENPLKVDEAYSGPNLAKADVLGPNGGEYTLKVTDKPRVINYPASGGEQSALLHSLEVVDPEEANEEDREAANAMRRLLASLESGDRVRVQGAAFDESFTVRSPSDGPLATVQKHLVKFRDNPMKPLPRYYERRRKFNGIGYRGKDSVGVVRRLTVYFDGGGKTTIEADSWDASMGE